MENILAPTILGLALGLALPLSDVNASPQSVDTEKCIATKTVTKGAGVTGTLSLKHGGNNVCPENKPCEVSGTLVATFGLGDYSVLEVEVNGQTVPGSPITIPGDATSVDISGLLDTVCETDAEMVLTLVSTATPPTNSVTTVELFCSDCQ